MASATIRVVTGRYLDVNAIGSSLQWPSGVSGDSQERLAATLAAAEDDIDAKCGRRFDLLDTAELRWFDVTPGALEDGIKVDDFPHDELASVVLRYEPPDHPDGTNNTLDRGDYTAEPVARQRRGHDWPANRIKLLTLGASIPINAYGTLANFGRRKFGGYPYTQFPSRADNDRVAYLGVTARWGWARVPHAISEATLLLVNRRISRLDSPLGMTGEPAYGLSYVRRHDPDIDDLIAPYRRQRFG